jgi:hypothetical protein
MVSELLSDGLVTIEIGGKNYKAGEITLEDFAQFENRCKEKRRKMIMESAREMYGDKVPPEIFERAVKPPTEYELNEYSESIEGAAFLVYRAMKKYSPQITEQEVSEMIKLSEMQGIMSQIMPVQESQKKTDSK